MTEDSDSDDTQVNPTVSMPRGFSTPDARADGAEAPVEKHSALVGYMSVPVHRLLPIRRSTLLLIILFLGFGTLCYLYPPNSGAITCDLTSGTCSGSGVNFPVPPSATSTTTTTPPPTTTTIRPTTPTTSGHVGGATSTTAAGQPAPTTTAPGTASTTTTRPATSGSTTTSSAPGVSGTGTTTTVPRP